MISCQPFAIITLRKPVLRKTLEITLYDSAGESFFGTLTGGVVESVRLSQGFFIRWHMFGGSAMWGLGGVQVALRRFRHGPLAWVHRLSGRAFLLLWGLLVGPTAFYLSLLVGVGEHRMQATMCGFAVAGMDTTVFAYYYFWRAYLVVRRRARGKESLALHGQAMRMGLTFTMLIIVQRPLQLFMISCRGLLVASSAALPAFGPLGWLAEGLTSTVLGRARSFMGRGRNVCNYTIA